MRTIEQYEQVRETVVENLKRARENGEITLVDYLKALQENSIQELREFQEEVGQLEQ